MRAISFEPMSLKARIEAVIYAAEEPVTLQQLAALFREEALLSRAERISPQADPEGPVEAVPALPPQEEVHTAEPLPEEPGAAPAPPATESLEADVPPVASLNEESPSAVEDPGAPRSAETGATPTSETAASEASAENEKRAARQRDREARDEIRRLIEELIADYSAGNRGLEIREVAGGFRMGTRAEYHDAVRAFAKSLKPPMKLSLQALETLAVIAYKQPITAPEISEIRGVDSGGVLGSLVARKLITTAGRKQVIGRPILYKTTKEFLLRFGLKDLNELPSIEEFEKMATELAEAEDGEGASSGGGAEELPFAQNEMAEVEEAVQPAGPTADESETRVASAAEGDDETQANAEPPNEAPTSEHDAAAEEKLS